MYQVGIAQINNHYDYKLNRDSICRAIEVHAVAATDLILFPECATTGYNRGLLTIDEPRLMNSIDMILATAQEFGVAVALPTPWPRGDGKFYNSLLFISEAGKILKRIDKQGFQNGEEKLFVPGEKQDRIFTHKGYRLGVLICIEASKEPWLFFNESDECDFILWPGFYATKRDATWEAADAPDDLLVKANIENWKRALIQVTCASSPESERWPDKLFGGSLVIDSHGKNIFCAKSCEEDLVVINFERREIVSVESLDTRE